MKKYHFLFLLVFGSIDLSACNDRATEATYGSIESIRGRTTLQSKVVIRSSRVTATRTIRTSQDSLARLTLDDGAYSLLSSNTQVDLTNHEELTFRKGKIWAEAPTGRQLNINSSDIHLRLLNGSASLITDGSHLSGNVIRGNLSYRTSKKQGIIHAGEQFSCLNGQVTVQPALLWNDWTGGLAEPGPRAEDVAEGVGTLHARIPDQLGEARFPLVIRNMQVRTKIQGDLAITEVEQVFFNPASEMVEGIYQLRVPQNAMLHRFAVDRNGHLVDGFIREKRQAEAAYNAQVYRGSTLDPALLEWDSPGVYQARIYPIQPGQSRRILIKYSEWLERTSAQAPRVYRYAMGTNDDDLEIQELRFEVDISDAGTERIRANHGARTDGSIVALTKSDFRPHSDFVLELLDENEEEQQAYRAEHVAPTRDPNAQTSAHQDESDYFFVPLVMGPWQLDAAPSSQLDLVIIADLSAATDRSQLELGRTFIESITSQLGSKDRVAIVTGDLTLHSLEGNRVQLGNVNSNRIRNLLNELAQRPPGGATDLGEMLRQAASLISSSNHGAVVYVGDGSPTVGELDAASLLESLHRLPNRARTYGIGIGTGANLELLDAITKGAGFATRVTTRAEAADATLRLLSHAARAVISNVEINLGTGIDQTYPRQAQDVVVGDVMPIIGRVHGQVPSSILIKGKFNGQAFEKRISLHISTLKDEGDLRLRWATSRLIHLLDHGANRTEIADLGTRFGIITPFTSFYVPSASELPLMNSNQALHTTASGTEGNKQRNRSFDQESEPDELGANAAQPQAPRSMAQAASGEAAPVINDEITSGSVAATGGFFEDRQEESSDEDKREEAPSPRGQNIQTRIAGITGALGRIAVPIEPPTLIDLSHRPRYCSDASTLGLAARKTLWKERLNRASLPTDWVATYERAITQCEIPTQRDRRVLLDLIIERAQQVGTMIQTYHAFASAGPRSYLKRMILQRVRSQEDLRMAREAFGAHATNAILIENELAQATDPSSKIQILRRLMMRFEDDMELALRLLQLFEQENRRDDAIRLSLKLRSHPLADAGVRTAIGEMLIRFGDIHEARRVMSEIVEFAPDDELARRRLGDLYRAHGWYDDAYRQYQTLATIRPDDLSVLLLLAQAAAGAGRIDEALRLEQRVAETAWPGGATGPARTAVLWSSVRLAELRKQAREQHDSARLQTYMNAMRRGGVLREAKALRATLVWSHPDADLQLWSSYPGLSWARPTDIAPEFGIEAFDVEEQEAGVYRLQVRRNGHDSLTNVEAKLIVVFREGESNERIEVIPIRMSERSQTIEFNIQGDSVRRSTP